MQYFMLWPHTEYERGLKKSERNTKKEEKKNPRQILKSFLKKTAELNVLLSVLHQLTRYILALGTRGTLFISCQKYDQNA